MLVIAHGQPKSGSTFLYATACVIAEIINQEEYYNFRNRVLGREFPAFHNSLPRELLIDVSKTIGPHRMFVVKTHCELDAGIEELVASKQVMAFTSFRDPRDAALSTLNVGAAERAAGVSRWFSKFEEIGQLAKPIRRQCDQAFRWARHPNVLTIPYYLIAAAEAESVGRIARHLGRPELRALVASRMDVRRQSVPEFNKGILDRFVDELSVEELRSIAGVWSDIIEEYNNLLEENMANLGHRMIYEHYSQLRDEALHRKLHS